MKATLEFNLPEDRDEHTLAIKGPAYFHALDDVAEMLRQHWKYGEFGEEARVLIDAIHDEFYEIMQANGVSLEDVE